MPLEALLCTTAVAPSSARLKAAVSPSPGAAAFACTTTPMRERPTNPRLSTTIFPCFAISSITAGGATMTSAVSPAATRLRNFGRRRELDR